MFNKIILAGGNGYLGNVLAEYYRSKAKEIIVLSRRVTPGMAGVKQVLWDGETTGNWTNELEGADLLINLCGKNVNCRYTEENKAEIFQSRLLPTAALGKAVSEAKNPPECWINMASATIYRHAEDRPQDEDGGEAGTGFSVDVCQAWEAAFWKTVTPKTKKLILRVGIVLGRNDGAFPRLKTLALAGLGGHQGTGKQYISWVHEQDVARCTEWVTLHGQNGSVYNVTAPEAIQNKAFMQLLREAVGVPFGLPSPQWLLELGAKFIGTETELVLKSRWVFPKKLLEDGFKFQFAKPEHAIREILSART